MKKRQITSILLSIILAGSVMYTPVNALPVIAAEAEERAADMQLDDTQPQEGQIEDVQAKDAEPEDVKSEDEQADNVQPDDVQPEGGQETNDPEEEVKEDYSASDSQEEVTAEDTAVTEASESTASDQAAEAGVETTEENLETAKPEENIFKGVATVTTDEQEVLPEDVDGKSSDELFAEYVESSFSGQTVQVSPQKRNAKRSASSSLTGIDSVIYESIASELPLIAAGERASTVFEFSVDELGLEKTMWTAEELGLSTIFELDDSGNIVTDDEGFAIISQDAYNAVNEKLSFSLRKITNALLADYPYHLYWYDKTQSTQQSGIAIGGGYDETADDYVIGFMGSFSISFPVSADYEAGQYTVDTSIGKSVQTSVENADAIVDEYSSASDYDKLYGYKEEICGLVSYNEPASQGGFSYGNPWQMIWVFDGDPDTTVVCEGYSKAFKYLCDQSDFSGDISCITATGTMDGGDHMWNIVNMEDGCNYLVDVTNCDEGTVGAPDQLFLVGTPNGDIDNGYVFSTDSDDIEYCYEGTTRDTYSDDELTIASVSYGEEVPLSIITQPVDAYADNLGDTVEVAVEASGKDLTYQWFYKNASATKFLESSQKTDTYTVAVTGKVKNRLVYCKITDAYGNSVDTNTVGIYVNEPFEITKQPADAYVDELGETATISVTATGFGLTYQWYYKNASKKSFLASTNTTPTYSVTVNERSLNRQVYCEVRDINGEIIESDIVGIYLNEPFEITKQPADAYVDELGETATISVAATGSGLTYQWFYKNEGATKFLKSTNTTPTYSVTVNERSKNRQVYCKITDVHGDTIDSEVAKIYVSEPFEIVEQPQNVTVGALGDRAEVSVAATGIGLTYQWYYKNAGAARFLESTNTTPTYSVTVNERVRNRQVYCKITDANGQELTTDTVKISVSE